jgi:signal transduction histidine kinase
MPEPLTLTLRPWAIPYFAAAAITVGLFGLVFSRGRGEVRGPFLRLLGGVAAALFSWGAVHLSGDARTAAWLTRLTLFCAAFCPPLVVEFAVALTARPLPRLRRAAWILAAASGALAIATPWVIASGRAGAHGFVAQAGPLYLAVCAELAIATALPIAIARQLAIESRPMVRRQLQLVLMASALSALAFVDVLPVVGAPLPPLGWVGLLGASVTLLAAVVRYRLLDVRLALSRFLVWLALTLVGAAPFTLAAVPLYRLTAGRRWEMAIAAAAMVMAIRAWLALVQPRIERLVGRRRRDLDAAMAALEIQTTTLQSVGDLGRAIDRFLAALDRRLAALVVIDSLGRPTVALSAWGSVPAPTRGSPLLHELAHARAPISVEEVRGPVRVEIERACVRWGAEYLGPLVDGEQLLGLIAISPRGGGGRADVVEVEALDRMCVVVSGALAGARLYDKLSALSVELEQKAAARSQSLARALADLRGAEARLYSSEKLATLGQIVAGVAADLRDQVRIVLDAAGRLRTEAELLMGAAERARARDPAIADARFDEIARDMLPLLDAVGEGARRASAIAQDLYGFAPDDARLERRPAPLSTLVDSTLTLLGAQLRGVTVVRDYDLDLPDVPLAPGPIGQVILNLVLNAAQAMQGRGTLRLATRQTARFAELTVSDTGGGIPADVLPHIFEPFFSTKGAAVGTGLGLSVSFGIVERHGGRITVDSHEGHGSTFRVQLPLD